MNNQRASFGEKSGADNLGVWPMRAAGAGTGLRDSGSGDRAGPVCCWCLPSLWQVLCEPRASGWDTCLVTLSLTWSRGK